MTDKRSANTRQLHNLSNSYEHPIKRLKKSSNDSEEQSSYDSQESISYLFDNNDCLFEIFKYLPLSDLCTLTEVCSVLKSAAQKFFSLEYKRVKSRNDEYNALGQLGGKTIPTLIHARRLLSNFGEFIVEINVNTLLFKGTKKNLEQTRTKLLQLIIKYCKNLTELSIYGFAMKSKDVEMWKSLLDRITSLTLMSCELYGMSHVPSIGSKLKYLKMDHMKNVNYDKLTNLEIIELMYCPITDNELTRLIQLNKNLRKLSIFRCPLLKKINFKGISSLAFLKEFELSHLYVERNNFEMEIQQLSNLRLLEKLSFDCYGCSVSSLISKLVSERVAINNLHLSYGPVDDQMIEQVAQLTGIRSLTFKGMVNLKDEHLIKLATRLNALVLLDTSRNITNDTLTKIVFNANLLSGLGIGSLNVHINNATYDRMLDIVKNRFNKSKLKIVIYGEGGHILVPRGKLKENTKILQISEGFSQIVL